MLDKFRISLHKEGKRYISDSGEVLLPQSMEKLEILKIRNRGKIFKCFTLKSFFLPFFPKTRKVIILVNLWGHKEQKKRSRQINPGNKKINQKISWSLTTKYLMQFWFIYVALASSYNRVKAVCTTWNYFASIAIKYTAINI